MTNEQTSTAVKSGALRWLLRETLGNLFLIAILFGIVGRWDWWNGWAMSAIYMVWSVGTAILIMPVNPQMLAERVRPKAGGKKWDVVMVSLMGVFVLVTYLVACFDVRFGWSQPLPWLAQISGVIVAAFGYDILIVWSMVANAFFTAIVRIQSERGHRVATQGPYRFIRHPGYTGAILFHLATPFMLNSRWALIPAVLVAVIFVVRTALEDRTLQEELPGYKEYTQKTPYRLLPGIW